MQESMSKDFSYNHPFELAYWRYGLDLAQQWRERQGLPRHPQWDDILHHLAPLPQNDSIYVAGQPLAPFLDTTQISPNTFSSFDPFVTPDQQGTTRLSEADYLQKSRSDHPAVLGACALIPSAYTSHTPSPLYDTDRMTHTLRWVMQHWNWPTTWGWDYGMTAMAAARLGQTSTAVDALLIDQPKNTYLLSGHNFQTSDRLRLYLPGNGALLTAIAMMCAGWDGCPIPHNPGFPQDGTWNVRWEDLHRMQ